MIRSMENAYRLLSSPERTAFDLTLEPKESYERYNTGRFGQGCLLARRLTEAGARFIEVTTEYIPFVHWDTHESGHTTAERMKKEIDRPIAQLILDLEQRGLLDRTLVIIASEFSRDMLIEGVPGSTARDQAAFGGSAIQEMKHYGQHRHFTGGSSVVLFGGGMRRGYLYGATAQERPVSGRQARLGRRPARHDLHGHGHLAQNGLRDRAAARFTPPKTASASRSASCSPECPGNCFGFCDASEAGDCPDFCGVFVAKMGLSPSAPPDGVAPLRPARRCQHAPGMTLPQASSADFPACQNSHGVVCRFSA